MKSKLVTLELIGGLLGWSWIIASIAGLYFIAMAVFSDGRWSSVLWAFGIAAVSKWLARGFRDSQQRVAFEASLIEQGYSSEDAGKEWVRRYMGKG